MVDNQKVMNKFSFSVEDAIEKLHIYTHTHIHT